MEETLRIAEEIAGIRTKEQAKMNRESFPLCEKIGVQVSPLSDFKYVDQSAPLVSAKDLERILAKGVEVFCDKIEGYWTPEKSSGDVISGVVIDIKPIEKPETAEYLLKLIVDHCDAIASVGPMFAGLDVLIERAKKLTGG